MKEGFKGMKKMEVKSDEAFFELYGFCNSLAVDSTSQTMRSILQQLQPYRMEMV